MIKALGSKYIRLKSLTFWAAMVPLIEGLILVTLPLHGNQPLADVVNLLTGGTPPSILINAGLAGIGIRGALG